jgi:hypothetical protein
MLRINEINVGNLQEKKANAIFWRITLERKQDLAFAQCQLLYIADNGAQTNTAEDFQVEIDNSTLQQWGSDDAVIDNKILAYSPLFVKDTNFD